jgi:hypothetical protein
LPPHCTHSSNPKILIKAVIKKRAAIILGILGCFSRAQTKTGDLDDVPIKPPKCNAPSKLTIIIITLFNGSDINVHLPWLIAALTDVVMMVDILRVFACLAKHVKTLKSPI